MLAGVDIWLLCRKVGASCAQTPRWFFSEWVSAWLYFMAFLGMY
jgi:hypothetical protein